MNAVAARDKSDGGPLFHDRIPGTDDAVSDVIDRMRTALATDPIGRMKAEDAVIVLGEVLNNAVEHALAGRTDGWLDLTVCAVGGSLEVTARDDGRPMPPMLLGGGDLPDMGDVVADLPEGGFGWFLIHTLADDMIYERADGTNCLTFTL